jgi:hypothetical protein
MAQRRREIPAGSRFNNYTVIEEVHKPNKRRHRFFRCLCDCGIERVVRLDRLGLVRSCIQCSKKYDYLYKQHPDLPRDIQSSHAWEMWNNLLTHERGRGTAVCDEWHDFANYLPWYLEVTGLPLSDVLRGRNGFLSFFRAERILKENAWSPENFSVQKFVSERARDIPTFRYWRDLFHQELLTDELLSYKSFVTTFGVKLPYWFLVRRDITLPHSKHNSFWKKRDVRGQCPN